MTPCSPSKSTIQGELAPRPALGLGFFFGSRVGHVGFVVLGFGLRCSVSGLRTQGVGFCILGLGLRV